MHALARRSAAALLVVVASAVGAPVAQAQATSFFMAILLGASEVPPVTSSGFGVAFFGYDIGTNRFEVGTAFSGLTGEPLVAHIQRGAAGVNGPIAFTFSDALFSDATPFGFAGGSLPARGTLSGEDEVSLFAGSLYVNIGTATFPEGEIRGQLRFVSGAQPPQVVPEPATVLLLGSGLALLGLVGSRRRVG